jgi:hypothetical protein
MRNAALRKKLSRGCAVVFAHERDSENYFVLRCTIDSKSVIVLRRANRFAAPHKSKSKIDRSSVVAHEFGDDGLDVFAPFAAIENAVMADAHL